MTSMTHTNSTMSSQAMHVKFNDALEDDGVVLDLNHPLSGKDLTFEIELVDVADGPKLFGVPIVPFDPNKVVKKE